MLGRGCSVAHCSYRPPCARGHMRRWRCPCAWSWPRRCAAWASWTRRRRTSRYEGVGGGRFWGLPAGRASAAVLALPSPASPAEPLASHHAPLLQVLAGWVTEGEAAFGEMSGSAPVVHPPAGAARHCARRAGARRQGRGHGAGAGRGVPGLAQGGGQGRQGRAGAKSAPAPGAQQPTVPTPGPPAPTPRQPPRHPTHQYERILGKAALGRGPRGALGSRRLRLAAVPGGRHAGGWGGGGEETRGRVAARAPVGHLCVVTSRNAGAAACPPCHHPHHPSLPCPLPSQGARAQLEQALRVATSSGCAVTDSQLAEHHYRLGEVYWRMRGRYRAEKQLCLHPGAGGCGDGGGGGVVAGGGPWLPGPPALTCPRPQPPTHAPPRHSFSRRRRWRGTRRRPRLPPWAATLLRWRASRSRRCGATSAPWRSTPRFPSQ